MTSLLTPADIDNAIESLLKAAYEVIPTEINRTLITEWAEKNRVLKEGKFQGVFTFDFTPYMREIADCLSATSAIREIAVMKGTRMGATVALGENWIGYTIAADPAEMAYITSTGDMAGAQMELRIDSLINSSGIGHKIGTQDKRKGQRKTGDIKTRKVFPGGYIMAGSPRSPFVKRAFGFKKMYIDEIDAFPDDIDKEGDPIYLFRRRVEGYGELSKILWTSTPLYDHNSKIKQLFLEGDQSRYFVPCKHCGEMQYLKWSQLKFSHDDDDRLICKLDKEGRITESSVYYECEKCGGKWLNSDKDFFLPRGEWRPTAVPRRPNMRSFHLPSLLSPVGFKSWEDGVIDFLQIKHEGFPKLKMQNWINTFLGEPFVEEGETPKIEAILTRERNYHINTLPEGAKPVFLTLGADIQGDRIECEIVAWGKDKESWSIDYRVFYGDTAEVMDPCWENLRETILSEHCGMNIALAAIDAGHRTDTVYEFADSFDTGVHPLMGSESVRNQRMYIKLFKVTGRLTARIDVNTHILKQEIYKYLNRNPIEGSKQRDGFCHFPAEYNRQHFLQLTAEVMIVKNGKHIFDAGERRNEQLDCRVYALACLYAIKQAYEETVFKQAVSWEQFWTYTISEREGK